jgi:thiol-disulfide isomerase/thioredoxin
MKKTIVMVLLVSILMIGLMADEKELMQEIGKYYDQKNFTKALELIDKGLEQYKENQRLLRWKFYALLELKKYDEALTHIEANIKDQNELLGAKFYVLKMQGKYAEALDVALEKEKISTKKSPWSCFDLIELYIKLNNKEKALDWLDEAINRGFISYMFLYEDEFALIRDNARFQKAVAQIQEKIGINKAAKDFSVKLLSDETFSLGQKKGKVILIDFWATWCGPCRAGIPELKKYYQELNPKGFDIIGISLDDSREKLAAFIQQDKLPWNIAFSGQGWKDETAQLYGVNSIPSYWLIDKQGTLRHFGLTKDQLKKAIEELLTE